MTRIVAGIAGGRRLAVPAGVATRPTSDRTREALFSTLEAMRGGLGGIRFLDLYAGSGAVGLEAVSRGAVHALLVEADRRAARVIRTNIDSLALDGAELVNTAAERLTVDPPPGGAYDVAFADPPYATADHEIAAVVANLVAKGWLVPQAIVVVERPTRSVDLAWPRGITADRSKRYGETTLWYGRAVLGDGGPRAVPPAVDPQNPA